MINFVSHARLLRVSLAALAFLPVALRGAHAQSAAGPTYKVIVNASNPVSTLSREEASRLFLKKVTMWKNAKPVLIVDQKTSSPVRETFTKDVHGRQVSSVTSYWQQMIFSGRAVPPAEKSSDAEVAAYIAANETAIGYVGAEADLPAGVKVVVVTR
jgi:ABC-type phosphate transport system substrate-binding protein